MTATHTRKLRALDPPELPLTDPRYPQPGNWLRFNSFGWFDRPVDAERWTIYYTSHRDSGLIEQSNETVIDRYLERYIGRTVITESHNHWACGHIDGYAILCYSRRRKPTRAYATLCSLLDRMAEYPLLDEDDYSEREYVAACEYINSQAKHLAGEHDINLPTDQPIGGLIYSWLADNGRDRELENCDDTGAAPSDESILEALQALTMKGINP